MKILIIGLDGASPQLVERWINQLPTFKRFKEEGTLGLSIPPAPAQTPVAWTTFMTGKNPGKHGIFSFAMRKTGTYERRIIYPELIKSKTIWRIAGEHGKKIGVINMPMTTPQEIKGFMIPGFLHKDEGIPYPSEVQKKIRKKLDIEQIQGDLEIEVLGKVKEDPDNFFKRIHEITDQQNKVSLFLLQEEKWDLFATVFMGTDRIQHFFWKYIDENHPEYEPSKYREETKKYYMKMDKIINAFLETAPSNTTTILLSDHGFCPIQKEVLLNNYLQESGMLKIRDNKINLKKSKAVSYGYGDIWLNLKGREPHGQVSLGKDYEKTREKMTNDLQKIKIDQKYPIKMVRKREQIYWGPYVNEAPDLLVFFNKGWQAARSPEIDTTKRRDKRYVIDNPKWSGGHDGAHDPQEVPGIFGILGPKTHCETAKCNLWDLAPTILHLMNIQVPSDMDGKPICSIKS